MKSKFDMKGFRDFILRGNLIDLAVAVVIGLALTAVITALVKDIITPLIAAIIGKPSFDNLYFRINHSAFLYGDVLNAIISFLSIAAVVFFLIVKPSQALMAKFNPPLPDEPIPTTECRECLSVIPVAATRCAFCAVTQ